MRDASTTEQPPRAAADSRVSLAIITEPGHANAFGAIHGGVLLRLADECGALAAFRHSNAAQITTAALDAFTFLTPVRVGERMELTAEVTHVGRSSIEARIEVHAEPLPRADRRLVAAGFGLYVALDTEGRPSPAPPLKTETETDRRRAVEAQLRRQARLARRAELLRGTDVGDESAG